MYKKRMGERFSDWVRGYRSRPGDEGDLYDEEYYEDEYDDEPEYEEYDDGYEGFSDDDYDGDEPDTKSDRFSFSRRTKNQKNKGRSEERAPRQSAEQSAPKLYSMARGGNANIKIETPIRFDGVTKNIIDVIRSGSALIVNLERVSRQDFVRFVDFLAGAVYIMESDMQYVTDRILIIAPKSITLAGGEHKEVYEVEPLSTAY